MLNFIDMHGKACYFNESYQKENVVKTALLGESKTIVLKLSNDKGENYRMKVIGGCLLLQSKSGS